MRSVRRFGITHDGRAGAGCDAFSGFDPVHTQAFVDAHQAQDPALGAEKSSAASLVGMTAGSSHR